MSVLIRNVLTRNLKFEGYVQFRTITVETLGSNTWGYVSGSGSLSNDQINGRTIQRLAAVDVGSSSDDTVVIDILCDVQNELPLDFFDSLTLENSSGFTTFNTVDAAKSGVIGSYTATRWTWIDTPPFWDATDDGLTYDWAIL